MSGVDKMMLEHCTKEEASTHNSRPPIVDIEFKISNWRNDL